MLINRALHEGEYSTETILKDYTVRHHALAALDEAGWPLSPEGELYFSSYPSSLRPSLSRHLPSEKEPSIPLSPSSLSPLLQASLREELIKEYGEYPSEAYMETFRSVRQEWMTR
jgi:hypothetical protein